MLRAILNKSWRQHPSKPQLYSHLPPITNSIKVRRSRHGGHCWRSRAELISDVLLWTPSCGRAKAGRPVRTYIQQLCEDTGCNPVDLPEAMNNREEWRGRVRYIRAGGTTWWWWWWWTLMKERASRNQDLQKKSYEWSKEPGFPSCEILRTIFKTDKIGTQTNGPQNKKIDH